jgi:hypothetical protein
MERNDTGPQAGDEPTRIRLEELLADMQEVLTGLPATKLDPKSDENLAELPTSGIFDMRDMASAYEAEHRHDALDELPVTGPAGHALALPTCDTRRDRSTMLYFSAGALGVLLVALTVATTILLRAG